jgi:hypothetical protein
MALQNEKIRKLPCIKIWKCCTCLINDYAVYSTEPFAIGYSRKTGIGSVFCWRSRLLSKSRLAQRFGCIFWWIRRRSSFSVSCGDRLYCSFSLLWKFETTKWQYLQLGVWTFRKTIAKVGCVCTVVGLKTIFLCILAKQWIRVLVLNWLNVRLYLTTLPRTIIMVFLLNSLEVWRVVLVLSSLLVTSRAATVIMDDQDQRILYSPQSSWQTIDGGVFVDFGGTHRVASNASSYAEVNTTCA